MGPLKIRSIKIERCPVESRWSGWYRLRVRALPLGMNVTWMDMIRYIEDLDDLQAELDSVYVHIIDACDIDREVYEYKYARSVCPE